ncbi:MAG: hypothetical protein WB507_01715 [Solirubrobacterales bacterium]
MRVLAALCVSASWFSLAPTFASAAFTYVSAGTIPVAEFTPAHFSSLYAESVAVDDHNGHIYVADSNSGEILDYSSAADTEPELWTGSNTPDGSFGEGRLSVAVDNSTGDVYVADSNNRVIDKFDQNGNLITSFGDTSPSPNGQLAGLATPAESFYPDLGYYFGSWAIAVDQTTHDLYVVDGGHEVIDVFDENGAYQRDVTADPEGLYGREFGEVDTNGIAVSATTGDLYVGNYTQFGAGVYEFDSAGNYVSTWNGGMLPNGAASETPNGNFGGFYALTSLATEDATGHLFVYSQEHAAVDIFDPSGNFIAPQINADVPGGQGIAIDQATGDLYLSEGYVSNGPAVQVFKPVIVPDVSVQSASNVSATTATFSGHVDPVGGGEITACRFEYGTTISYGRSAPCAEGSSFSAPSDVDAEVEGLSPGTHYHYRLIATNANGDNAAIGSFSTLARYEYSRNIGSTGSGAGQLLDPSDVAVDETTGDIYVADTGNHRVVKFNSSGQFLGAWGWGVSDGKGSSEVCTSGCQAGIAGGGPGQFTTPSFIEVDNSSGESAGDVYVADTADNVVQKFDPSGQLVTSWGSGGATSYAEGIAGIAVESNGHLIVQAGSGQGIDVDAFGSVFGGPVAIDRATGERFSVSGEEIQAYSSANALLEVFGAGHLTFAQGLAFEAMSHRIYVANSGADAVSLFVPRAVPEVSTGPAAKVSQTSVTVTGKVNPGEEGSVKACYFEYGTTEAYDLGSVPCSPAAPISTSTEVSAELPGLTPFITYHYRLVTVNSDGTNFPSYGRDLTVTPNAGQAPTIGSVTAGDLTPTTATLMGEITPNLAPTTYRIQYGTTGAYGEQTLPSESIGEGASPLQITTELSNLEPATTYHFRLLAINFSGVADGPDGTFTTPDSPVVSAGSATAITPTSANISAGIRPGFRDTTYHFEYGPTTGYGSKTPESGSIGSDNAVHAAVTTLSGLTPATTFHYRVVATNSIGAASGPDQTFTTGAEPTVVQKPVTCKHGFVEKHGRCVKKPHPHRGHRRRKHHRGSR